MEDNKISMDNFQATFVQSPDCMQNDDNYQEIEVHLEDNGMGRFIWFKTDRWAIDDINDLQRLIDRVRAIEKANDILENKN